jgi:hypothetical protein
MNIQGRLQSPEFENCSLPLTAIINGKKKVIGRASIGVGGVVEATVDNEEIKERLNREFLGQLSVKLNPEVRLEPRPATPVIPM